MSTHADYWKEMRCVRKKRPGPRIMGPLAKHKSKGAKPSFKGITWGFPGGLVVKNLSAIAGDPSSIPDPGRSHLLQSNEAHVQQVLSLCSRA